MQFTKIFTFKLLNITKNTNYHNMPFIIKKIRLVLMKILMYILPSPDGNGNPGTLESSFS